jgi:hypothetical protein
MMEILELIDFTEPAESCMIIVTPQAQTKIEVPHTGTPNEATKHV